MLTDKIEAHFRLREVPLPAEVGIEVEMEGVDLRAPSSIHWRTTNDGSLRAPERVGGVAVEFVLSRPCARQEVKKRLALLWRLMAKDTTELLPSRRCGIHIHINCQHMTVLQVINFIVLYAIYETALLRFCGPERTGNLFCLRMQDAEALVYELVTCVQRGSLRPVARDTFRYGAINPVALARYGSLEFRALPTTARYDNIVVWVRMLLALKDAAMAVEFPANIIEGLSGKGGKEALTATFGADATLLDYPELIPDMMENVRRIQAVAYAEYSPEARKQSRHPFDVMEGLLGTEQLGGPVRMQVDRPRRRAEQPLLHIDLDGRLHVVPPAPNQLPGASFDEDSNTAEDAA